MSDLDDEVKRNLRRWPILAARGHAINAYSAIEISLCALLSYFGDMPEYSAVQVLYRMNNARSRNEMLESIKRQKLGNQFNLFWNSAIKQVGCLDSQRNQIIHWQLAVPLFAGEPALKPGGAWITRKFESEVTFTQILNFIDHATFISRALAAFHGFLRQSEQFLVLPPERSAAWQGIFQQALTYPLPDTHPLFQKPITADDLR
jgi:hypothetical protein